MNNVETEIERHTYTGIFTLWLCVIFSNMFQDVFNIHIRHLDRVLVYSYEMIELLSRRRRNKVNSVFKKTKFLLYVSVRHYYMSQYIRRE